MQNLSNHAAPNCNTQKCQGLSNLHTKNWKLDWSFTPKSSTLSRCAQSARDPIRRAQFAAPGAQFAGPDLQGPICHSIKKCGAQFAAKSARGLICLEPQHVAPYLPCLSCQVQCSGLDILFQLHVLVVHSFHFLIFLLFHILLHHCFIPQSACSQNVVRM